MRLLHVRTFVFEEFHAKVPAYAILSHRWTDQEAKLADVKLWHALQPDASTKVYGFIRYIRAHFPDIHYVWVDSCCIDQTSAAELSEAVNRMFDWYRNANVCIAYLADVDHPSDGVSLSVWFRRGWTLQELLASSVVIFLTKGWEVIGHKGDAGHFRQTDVGLNIESLLADVTGIPAAVLQDFDASHAFSIDERMRWMVGRETLREEDMFYALFGIFGVTPGANYGEKRAGAEQRLWEALERKERRAGHRGASQPSPAPIQTTLFSRNPDFVEREELHTLQDKLSRPEARVAIVGFGGVGKTQLAIEHCCRVSDERTTWVFWLHASSAARFDQDIHTMAADLKIPGWEEKDANHSQLVRGWLLDGSKKWLIVIDNADDVDFLFEAPQSNSMSDARTRMEYFPPCSHGSILVTTRWQKVARRLVDSQDVVALRPDKPHAIRLMKTKLSSLEHANVERLAAALEYMPLAITQAAAYIQKAAPRCTVEDYLLKLEKSDKSKATLLGGSSKELRRNMQAKDSIMTTWQISFEHILKVRRSAADLLSLMSFFDNQGIPDFLVNISHCTKQVEQDADEGANDTSSEEDSDAAFEDDVNTLRDYSFVSADKSVLQMHRLVQLAAQLWLKERKLHTQWEVQSLRRLDEVYPEPHYQNWQMCRLLQPHAALALQSKVYDKDGLMALESVLYRASWFAREQGAYTESEAMAMQSLSLAASIYGERDASTLCRMARLAATYWSQGRLSEAEELQQEVLKTRRTVLGTEHPDTLASMNNLAVTYMNQKRFTEAVELQEDELATRRIVQGAEHPSTLNSMDILAMMYVKQGRFVTAAEKLQLKALETMRTVLGAEHPDTLKIMGNLASTYSKQGRLTEAEKLHQEVLETRRTVLGAEHPDTLASMNNLAVALYRQRRLREALRLAKICLSLSAVKLGAMHPQTLVTQRWVDIIEEEMQTVDTDSAMARLVVSSAEEADMTGSL